MLLGRWEDVSDWGRGGGEHGGRGDHPNLSHPQAVVQITYRYERYLKTSHGRRRGMLLSPLCWVWPLGVTLSLGSIDSGFTASVTENGFLENLWKYGKLHPDKVHWGKICRLFWVCLVAWGRVGWGCVPTGCGKNTVGQLSTEHHLSDLPSCQHVMQIKMRAKTTLKECANYGCKREYKSNI